MAHIACCAHWLATAGLLLRPVPRLAGAATLAARRGVHTPPSAVEAAEASAGTAPTSSFEAAQPPAQPPSQPAAPGSADTSPASADERFMRLALEQAALASAADEVPVGAVLVSAAGDVLAAAHNATESSRDPTAHAELLCIRRAAMQLGGWRLLDATLYVTLEPCPMCAGALLQARVGAVVYGARNNLLGADGSWIAMLPQAGSSNSSSSCSCSHRSRDGSGGSDCSSNSSVESGSSELAGPSRLLAGQPPAEQPSRPHPFHPILQVRRGVLATECADVMRSFFARRRKQNAEAAAVAKVGGSARQGQAAEASAAVQ